MAKRVRVGQLFKFKAVGYDIFDRRHKQLQDGQTVRVCQPNGCPKNGTMGHCFIEYPNGEPIGLVLMGSLQPLEK